MTITSIPAEMLYHTTVVSRDLHETALNYARFYGISRWRVNHYAPERLHNPTIFGMRPSRPEGIDVDSGPPPGEYGFSSAIGSNESGSLCFEIVQPNEGLSTFRETLEMRGPSVHSFCLTQVRPEEIEPLRLWLAQKGVSVAQSFSLPGVADVYYFDTRRLLGAYFYLQVVVPQRDDWQEALGADEEWDLAGEVPEGPHLRQAREISHILHFGMIAPDLVERTRAYADLFGKPLWRGMNWGPDGRLFGARHYDKVVDHGFMTSMCREVSTNPHGQPLGFEVMTPTYGPSHYRDFLNETGGGVHHCFLNLRLRSQDEERSVLQAFEDLNAPLTQGGYLNSPDGQFYAYWDTRKTLGYCVELMLNQPPDDDPRRRTRGPDFWYDFSAQATG